MHTYHKKSFSKPFCAAISWLSFNKTATWGKLLLTTTYSVCECFIFKLLWKLIEFNLMLQISRKMKQFAQQWDLSTCVAPEWASSKVKWRGLPWLGHTHSQTGSCPPEGSRELPAPPHLGPLFFWAPAENGRTGRQCEVSPSALSPPPPPPQTWSIEPSPSTAAPGSCRSPARSAPRTPGITEDSESKEDGAMACAHENQRI